MAAAFESLGQTTYAGSRTTTSVTAPSGIENGDILLAPILTVASDPGVTVAPPSVFSELPGSWPVADGNGGLTLNYYVYAKTAANETAETYDFTHNTASSQGAVMRISGAKTSGGFAPNPTQNTGTANDSTYSGLTTTADDSLLICVHADWGDTGSPLTPPTGFTGRMDTTIMFLATMLKGDAGATGDLTMLNNSNDGSGNPWFAILIALHTASANSTRALLGIGT